MKNLRKIIVLFIFIFLTGIFITVATVNSSLNKKDTKKTILEVKRDTTYLLQAEHKNI
ncbi:hypothetical protein [uncultured Polaribacter sp.]|uniref:hypothetical protein n=1 Tax=uncultured Polaribacter sp. TaxID=174711 RepID=UPI0026114FC2|nr:hypothetical protein [uncultured Polaribacter sp.]